MKIRSPAENKTENSQNTTEEKQPFVIVAADYEDEDPNDLKDAESVHGNRRPYRGNQQYVYHEKNNYNDEENKRIYSLNDDLQVNRNKRRGKATRNKNRQPFVISVPDDENDYNYDDDYKDDYKTDYYNNKDDDYKDDLRKEQSSYLRDPFLLEVSFFLSKIFLVILNIILRFRDIFGIFFIFNQTRNCF